MKHKNESEFWSNLEVVWNTFECENKFEDNLLVRDGFLGQFGIIFKNIINFGCEDKFEKNVFEIYFRIVWIVLKVRLILNMRISLKVTC